MLKEVNKTNINALDLYKNYKEACAVYYVGDQTF